MTTLFSKLFATGLATAAVAGMGLIAVPRAQAQSSTKLLSFTLGGSKWVGAKKAR